MNYYFLDTSAVLNGAYQKFDNVYISPIVLMELENIKTSQKDEQTKYLARKAVRDIIASKDIHFIITNTHAPKKFRKYPFLEDIHDHWLIAEAAAMKKYNNEIYFVTSDGAQYLIAKQVKELQTIYFGDNHITDTPTEDYSGWGKYYPNEEELTMLYSDPKINILKCKTNEFAEIYVDGELKDILFWTGSEYRKIKYKDIRNPYINETIKPRNIEQKMAFDLLQNNNIKVKLLTSAWGGGKTLMALTYALERVHHGDYQKLVFVRNNIIVADTNDIGFLPGDLRDKMSIWGAPLADHLGGQEMLDQLIDDRVIEIYPLSHMRGRSICSSIVLCDECENMNDKLITFLMSRIEADSEIIFCGDVAQIDHYKFEKNNGIRAMLKHLAGEPLFGTVKLLKSERGPVATLCDKIRPPV